MRCSAETLAWGRCMRRRGGGRSRRAAGPPRSARLDASARRGDARRRVASRRVFEGARAERRSRSRQQGARARRTSSPPRIRLPRQRGSRLNLALAIARPLGAPAPHAARRTPRHHADTRHTTQRTRRTVPFPPGVESSVLPQLPGSLIACCLIASRRASCAVRPAAVRAPLILSFSIAPPPSPPALRPSGSPGSCPPTDSQPPGGHLRCASRRPRPCPSARPRATWRRTSALEHALRYHVSPLPRRVRHAPERTRERLRRMRGRRTIAGRGALGGGHGSGTAGGGRGRAKGVGGGARRHVPGARPQGATHRDMRARAACVRACVRA